GLFDGERLCVDRCLRGIELPGSGAERERCLAALRVFIGAAGESTFGCDFPFAVPRSLMPEDGWEAFLSGFAGRYPDAATFRAACFAAAGGRELRRLCDVESRTPFSAYNLRLYRQTYAGITGLLAPLVEAGAIRVLPMQAATEGSPRLLEVCPASALK